MPESYTPKQLRELINSKNPNGPEYDPYGTRELTNQLLQNRSDTGDIFASAELEVAAREQKLAEAQASREQKLAEARAALANFTTYLAGYLRPETIQDKLGELEVYYDETTGSAVIARPDRQPFILNLEGCGLKEELPLPKQLLINSLYCTNNQLSSLPELPDSLTVLWCYVNQLSKLPELPDSLTELHCYNNQLSSLPELPDSLTRLDCEHNQLTSLPELPDRLTVLDCRDNPLTADARQKIRERQQRRHFELFM